MYSNLNKLEGGSSQSRTSPKTEETSENNRKGSLTFLIYSNTYLFTFFFFRYLRQMQTSHLFMVIAHCNGLHRVIYQGHRLPSLRG